MHFDLLPFGRFKQRGYSQPSVIIISLMMMTSNGNVFRVTGEFKASDIWVNNCEAGDLRRNRAHYDVSVMHMVS